MSQENLEVVRRSWEAYAQGGFAATKSFLHPDFEMSQLPDHADAGTFRGGRAAVKSMEDWMSTFEDFRAEPQEFIDAGGRVVVALIERGRAGGSGIELHKTYYVVYTMREGRILRMQWFGDRNEALQAAAPPE